jgi:Activator of Hsp90 ATPase homolog 1-like protein
MTKVILGNHSSVLVPRTDRENINQFYVEVLGGKLMQADPDRDFIRLGDNFFIAFLYGEVEDAGDLHRSARAIWLELKSDEVAETRQKILDSGLVRRLEIPDPHLYFQAPGGQCLRLVGVDEDLSFYEGTGTGPDMAKIKAALQKNSLTLSFTAKISTHEALDKISNVSQWWGVGFEGIAKQQGDHFIVKMGSGAYFNCTVTELIPDKKMVWTVDECYMPWYSDKQEWKDTRMIFELFKNEGETRLTFTHEGLTPDVECYKDCKPGWTHWITRSLFSYLTTGKGDFDQR